MHISNKKSVSFRVAALLICVFVILSEFGFTEKVFAAERISYTPYPKVEYSYSETVQPGTVRYIEQMKHIQYYDYRYWGKWSSQSRIECGTSSISMSLSYIGINKTPKEILDAFHGSTRINYNWGGSKYKSLSLTSAINNYLKGNGKYSPPIIHLNNYSARGHYVVIIGKVGKNQYYVLDPAGYYGHSWVLTLNGNTVSYFANGCKRTDYVKYAQQYYRPGKDIKYEDASYAVTGKDTVTYKAPISKNAPSLQVPDSIYLNGKQFRVTAVKAGAFKNNKMLTSVEFGANVETIGKQAFEGCKKLRCISINTINLKKIGDNSFSKASKDIKVKIPAECNESYENMIMRVASGRNVTLELVGNTAETEIADPEVKGASQKREE